MTTGEYIRKKRKEKKITQEELARRIGTKHSVISKYENDIIDPSFDVLSRIAEALDLPRETVWMDVLNIGLDKIIADNSEIEKRFNTPFPPDYGIDLDALIKECRKAAKENNPGKATELQAILKDVLPNIYSNLSVYQDLEEVLQKEAEKELLAAFHDLNLEGKKIAADIVDGLSRIEKYQNKYGSMVENIPLVDNPFSKTQDPAE